jgi:hypothetical protein
MSKEKIFSENPTGFELNEDDVLKAKETYSIPNEEACSAEFSEGCIKNGDQQE